MIVPFKIALIAIILAAASIVAGRIFEQYQSPFPRVVNWADHAEGICGLFMAACLLIALVAVIYGIVVL